MYNMYIVCIRFGVYITLFRFDDIRKSGHYSKFNLNPKDAIH